VHGHTLEERAVFADSTWPSNVEFLDLHQMHELARQLHDLCKHFLYLTLV
jgi:hypothetical protein